MKRYGPHGLRDACATYLLTEGFTLKQIGDHLGHSLVQATEIYAKVDVASLAIVGDVDLGQLIKFNTGCERSYAQNPHQFFVRRGEPIRICAV